MKYSTLFVGLYGQLILHQQWQDINAAKSDAYSLFVARASAMSWLENRDMTHGLWGMNDAGIHVSSQQLEGATQQAYTAWFQVGLPSSISPNLPLPIQPFLSCVGDVVERMGRLSVEAIQILLPVEILGQSADISAMGALLQAAGWFADHLPQDSVQVRLTLDSGQNPSIRSVAPDLFKWMQTMRQDVIKWDSFSLTEADGVMNLKPLFIDELWNGPAEHRVTFRGTLVNWSLDALGWVSAFLASASAQQGISTPLVLTVQLENKLLNTLV